MGEGPSVKRCVIQLREILCTLCVTQNAITTIVKAWFESYLSNCSQFVERAHTDYQKST
jgi:hypothetical protein